MRLAPLPIFLAASRPAGLAAVGAAVGTCGASCRTTHGHPAAVDSCRYFGALLLGALAGESKARLLAPLYEPDGAEGLWDVRASSAATRTRRPTPSPTVPEAAAPPPWQAPNALPHHGPVRARVVRQGANALCEEVEAVARGSFWRVQPTGDAFAPRSLEAALWAFARTDNFAAGAVLVANLGGDADTTAAIYGQLAGAHYGEEGLPAAWEAQLFFAPVRPRRACAGRVCRARVCEGRVCGGRVCGAHVRGACEGACVGGACAERTRARARVPASVRPCLCPCASAPHALATSDAPHTSRPPPPC
eukprot:5104995-Prymnesium_polylepis.1